MSGPDPDRFAALLCDWCLEVQPGQQVLVVGSWLAQPLARSLHRELLQQEAWPVLRLAPHWQAADFHHHARDAQLDSFAAVDLAEMQAVDAFVAIDAPTNTRALAGVQPALIARLGRARRPIAEVRLGKRWCGTLWPTPALAQQAGMSDDDYCDFVARALFLDQPDPVQAWAQLSAAQAALVERLSSAGQVRIEAPGTDLTLQVGGRTWINSDGRRNMPSGEVFTGPIEDSANGTVRFGIPSNLRGVEVSGIELTFRDGEVVAARAQRGDEFLQTMLGTDPGAVRLGELGIGTNPGIDRATGSTLLDEKIAGTVHLALGRSYPETGATNSSAIHWDMICDLRSGGRLTIDGQLVNDNGRFVG